MMRRRAWCQAAVAAVGLGGWGAGAQSQPSAPGATWPAGLALGGEQWGFVGQGSMRFLGWRVYHARLWAAAGFRPDAYDQTPLALELEYLRAFSAAAIAQRSVQEMRRVGPFPEAQAQRWEAALTTVLPDVAAGDRLLGLHRPGQGARFAHNGRPVGEVADPWFARLFFGIWLSGATSEPGLRLALLGGTAQ
jgi:Chalcone isomerase-like